MPATTTRTDARPTPAEVDTLGRTTAITVISAIKPWWAVFLRFNFWRVRLMRRLTGPSKIDRALKNLSFIHFAHWAVFKRSQQPYLLFQSNFNGGAQEYIEAFSMTVRTGMRALWGGAYGVPPPTPVGPFIDYIRAAKIPTTFYYCAYPEASTTMVCNALELRRKFESFRVEASELDAHRFAEAYARFMTEVHRRPAEPGKPGKAPAGRRTGLCVLTPFTHQEEARVRQAVADLPRGDASPFAADGRTHFARFVIVPYLTDGRGHQVDGTSYLLFAAEFDGSRDEYIESLASMPGLRSIWPGVESSSRFLLEHGIEPGYSVIGYPGATVADVRDSLSLEKQLGDFFVTTQGLEPSELRRTWQETFPP